MHTQYFHCSDHSAWYELEKILLLQVMEYGGKFQFLTLFVEDNVIWK